MPNIPPNRNSCPLLINIKGERVVSRILCGVLIISALLSCKAMAEVFDWEDPKTGYMFAVKTSNDSSAIVVGTVGIAELPPNMQTGIYYANQNYKNMFEQYIYTPGTPFPELQQKQYRTSPAMWAVGTKILVNTSSNGIVTTYSAEGSLRLASGSESFPVAEEQS